MSIDLRENWHIRDVEISAAIDIDKNKVGKDLSEAIVAWPNNTFAFAKVPRTASVQKNSVSLTVTYNGNPKFAPIPPTAMSYAANTPMDVIEVGDVYFCCHQAVWFTATDPSTTETTEPPMPADTAKTVPFTEAMESRVRTRRQPRRCLAALTMMSPRWR